MLLKLYTQHVIILYWIIFKNILFRFSAELTEDIGSIKETDEKETETTTGQSKTINNALLLTK